MDFVNRQYDPQIGRFLSVDPLADDDQEEWSPYAAMGNNPAMMVDPLGLKGDNVKSIQGNPTAQEYPGTEYKGVLFFREKNAPIHGVDGAALANYLITGNSKALFGEKVQQGSGETAGNDLGQEGGKSKIKAGTGEKLGKDAFDHTANIPAGTTELATATAEDKRIENGSDPNAKGHLDRFRDEAISAFEWYSAYKGKTWTEIATQEGYQYKLGIFQAMPRGPSFRYVLDPLNSKAVIDMRHFMVVGSLGRAAGNAIELGQNYTDPTSSNDPQDYYSNELGYKFFNILNNHPERFAPYYKDVRLDNPYKIDYGRLIGIFLMSSELRK